MRDIFASIGTPLPISFCWARGLAVFGGGSVLRSPSPSSFMVLIAEAIGRDGTLHCCVGHQDLCSMARWVVAEAVD